MGSIALAGGVGKVWARSMTGRPEGPCDDDDGVEGTGAGSAWEAWWWWYWWCPMDGRLGGIPGGMVRRPWAPPRP